MFEQTPFIKGVDGQTSRFDYRGRHGVLFEDITPADVRWICEQLQRLTDAAVARRVPRRRLPPAIADRFIRRMKQKIDEGLALKDS